MKTLRKIVLSSLLCSFFSTTTFAYDQCLGQPNGPLPPAGKCSCQNEVTTCHAR
ncbi:hypothetical protein [Acinetobacter sp. ANC 3882]|uniref:hypothetical protein n=1 Tax=Acinetobacter sp. ANC 3882 TaxID=2923423 RepID=UPI001F4A5B99|nr:hypothetical protein [Acinetobacter sp. ANC 3882]MCH7315609.1 hypothetical protein [Acinetobacter sp. ANC 3882]